MTGLEVIGGISAVIAMIDGSVKVWNGARKDLKFSVTFETVAKRLPILRDTLQTCHEHFEPIQTTLPATTAESLSKTVQSCEEKAKQLRTIFKETIPGDDEQWYERYRKVAKRLGKGSKVEELMKAITEDAQNLFNYHSVKSARPKLCTLLCTQLEVIVAEMQSIEPSLPDDDAASQTLNTYGGPQNVSTGSSTQYNSSNTGSGQTHNYGGITGNPVFNIGTVLSGRIDFAGSYAHSSLHPVATYVRRPGLERRLREQLLPLSTTDDHDEMRTVVVWGLGGSGKSQLVLNYVQEHRRQYRAVFWVEADRKETIERDFVRIYKLLVSSPASGSTTTAVEDAISDVKEWLHGQAGRYLWVMDSADEIEGETSGSSYIDLNHYLPETPQLDRIITTRSSRAQAMSMQDAVEVKDMSEDEAVQLFRQCARLKQTHEQHRHEVVAIVQELGCLALAVTLAGSYVHETPGISSDLGRYLKEFQEHRERLLGQKAHRLVHRYGESVLSTWEISFSTVQQQLPVAASLLSLLVFLNFDDIFPQLFTVRPTTSKEDGQASHSRRTGLRNRFSRLLEAFSLLESVRWTRLLSPDATPVDDNAIVSAFKTLQAYSLVSWRADQEAYSMHKLVHAWGHDRLDLEQRQERSAAVLELLSSVIQDHQGDLGTEARLVPHVMANFTAISSVWGSGRRLPDRDRKCVERVGDLLKKLGRWDDEHELRVFLKRTAELVLGREHPDTLRSMNNLAMVLGKQGKYDQAETMHRQTLELTKKVLGREHPWTLTSMNNLATGAGEAKQARAGRDDVSTDARADKEGAGARASLDTDEHEQPGHGADRARQVRGGRDDTSTDTRADEEGAGGLSTSTH
ncbi:hypothetical protein LTS08_008833 [Lithohypha guttulata]|uniref:Uncharacterized protein n=1 Tax=Lithohypha guttulata TaxID=1690604 RepID=A0ABR0K1I9_9EURO|nr:hypothetical protein LTR24_007943 [Lithohypha guttulata]KAK5093747.1 hypothetical protein LTS08_008833 [Lithohypha guttulata]KAK5313370.1 hypothetical protein LTR70_007674 [Exophiala xenobiotica]